MLPKDRRSKMRRAHSAGRARDSNGMRESIFDLLEVGRKQPEDRPIHRGLRLVLVRFVVHVELRSGFSNIAWPNWRPGWRFSSVRQNIARSGS